MVKTRAFLARFQQDRCYLCAQVMMLRPFRGWMKHPSYATVDHVRPAVDGHTKVNNSLLACRRCNGDKGARQPRPCEVLYAEMAHQALREEVARVAMAIAAHKRIKKRKKKAA